MICSEVKARSGVKWRRLLNDIVITCFRVADVVLPVVSHCSPEGNIPDDLSLSAAQWQGQFDNYFNQVHSLEMQIGDDSPTLIVILTINPEP